MTIITDTTFDQERALYGVRDVRLERCAFDGSADGESALKEARDVEVADTLCNLRYPFWHDRNLLLERCELTPLCRAALWYSENIRVEDTRLHGIKALRECAEVSLRGCDVLSPEFGWSTRGLRVEDSTAEGEYFLLRAADVDFRGVRFKGKYAFQYVENATLENCVLDTKDAFWHAKNITVRDSVVKGEYLGWYSDGLTLIRCKISGTQPLCYCKNLKLVDCELTEADLCFEKSQVEATLTTPVVSIKNPASGRIDVPSLGALIRDDPACVGQVWVKGQQM